MDISAGSCKEKGEQFILLKILPHLEKSWGRCSYQNREVYKILAKIGYGVNSETVVRHAIQLLFHLICKDNLEGGNGNLMVVEEIIRSSIFSTKGMFGKDEHSEKTLKLFLYSRILSSILLQQVLQEDFAIVTPVRGLKKAQEELRRCYEERIENKKKNIFRYSVEFILETICLLLKSKDKSITTKLSSFLRECKDFCEDLKVESKDLKVLENLKKAKLKRREWIVLHCILIHLHGKVKFNRISCLRCCSSTELLLCKRCLSYKSMTRDMIIRDSQRYETNNGSVIELIACTELITVKTPHG